MNDRQSIIGFTEAQLGFFIAILCLVLWAGTLKGGDPPPPPTIRADSAAKLMASLKDSAHVIDSLRRVADSLKSPITPSCTSKGLASGPLMSLTAIHHDLVRLEAESLTLTELGTRSSDARSKAELAGCRHEVTLHYVSDLSAEELDRTMFALERMKFRVLRRRAVPK